MSNRQFIDLFAGCGGLSLGLSQGGWRGLFAVERDSMAFGTLSQNLIEVNHNWKFCWPGWLEQRPWSIDDLLKHHLADLRRLRGSVSLIAGGPPCQGFSFAGRRKQEDPRNMLFKRYVAVVEAVQPTVLILENVPGMRVAHGTKAAKLEPRPGRPRKAYSERLLDALELAGYHVEGQLLDAVEFGVPQRRPRFVVFGIRKSSVPDKNEAFARLNELIEEHRLRQLKDFELPLRVTAKEAIGDLEVKGTRLVTCTDLESPRGFMEPFYSGPKSAYQRLMNEGMGRRKMNSLRLARHTEPVRTRFARILQECRAGVSLDDSDRIKFGLTKQRTFPLSPDHPAATVTTLPDDMLHYSEPRILSVRESARLQSFPDWFKFKGKYTTGGDRRTRECPRYTQVGNAVAPLLARALGLALRAFVDEIERDQSRKMRPRPFVGKGSLEAVFGEGQLA